MFALRVRLRPTGAGAARESELLQRLDPSRSRAGWLAGRGGVVLVSSRDDGPFPRAGVPVGSVVHAVDGRAVLSERDLIRSLQAREPGARVEVVFTDPDGRENLARVELLKQPTCLTGFKIPILLEYEADADGTETSFELVDLFLLSLFRYERQGRERRWSVLGLLRFATGVGELSE